MRRRWVLRIAIGLVGGIAVALAMDVARLGGTEAWLAARGFAPPYEARGALVDAGDRRLYLDCRGAGGPTVVLENGLGSGSAGWGFVLPELAERTRVCAYDRAGLGRSESAPRRPVSAYVEELRALLAAAGERPPWVLVGMSLGGTHVRVFTARHPDEVVGVVLVDAYLPDIRLPSASRLPPAVEADFRAAFEATTRSIEATEPIDWRSSLAELSSASIAGRPVEVLSIPQELRMVHEQLDPALQAVLIDEWEVWILGLSPGRTRITIAERSGHIIQIDRPDLVIAAVERILAEARGS